VKDLTIFLLIVAISIPAACQKADKSGVQIGYEFQAQHVTLHEPVMLSFHVMNATTKPLNLDLGMDRKGGFGFSVTRPDGTKVTLPPFTARGLARVGKVVVQPAEAYSQNLLLNEWYEFSMIGKYEVEGRLVNPIVSDSTSEKDAGFRQSIEVGPRDELSLTKTCDALAAKVEVSPASEQAHEAAFALSFVKDPIAVPYLRRALLADKTVALSVVNGLEMIGNGAAVQALGDGLKAVPAFADAFKSSLGRIRQQSSDPRVREDVDRILNP
jgi:PBS lyase HEAT-like repeat